jgi:beta-glucanase (GH16 family)
MRRFTVVTAAAVLFCASLGRSTGADAPAADAPAPPPGYKLVWSDEFNYAGKPDPSKWTYERGYVRNREPQLYTDDLANARVEDGHLVVEARADPAHPGKFTSASVITQGKAAWTYGRIEVRAKLPTAPGAWPAIWMLGDNHGQVKWPLCGEIDIMELWAGRDAHLVRSTVHFAHDGKHGSSTGAVKIDDAADYHVYATEWTPEAFSFFVDDTLIKTVEIAKLGVDGRAFHAPQYLLLNVALDTKQGPIEAKNLPMQMLVDWVRVYQKQ